MVISVMSDRLLVACDWKHIKVAELIKKYEEKALGKVGSAKICVEN